MGGGISMQELQQWQQLLSQQGTFSAADIQALKGVSQPTASRIIRRLKQTGRLVIIGRGKHTCYAFTDGSPSIQIHKMDADGAVLLLGDYYRLSSGASYINFVQGTAEVLKGVHGNGRYEGMLPFFLDDMKPEGFMGIRNAKGFVEHGFPSNLSSWRSEQILMFLKAKSYESKGNILVVGDYSLNHLTQEQSALDDYPHIARETLNNYMPRCSSAGGEQPKFTAYREGVGHVIVKFAQAKLSTVDLRRADLLVCEYLANMALSDGGFSVAKHHLHVLDGMFFLESIRFDRVDDCGRLPMVSMTAIDAEYIGYGGSWCETAKALMDRGRIALKTYQDIQQLDMFGRLIGNTDMHLGNLSFTISADGKRFELLPLYDMLPMVLMPRGDVIPDRIYTLKPSLCTKKMLDAAQFFWQSVVAHKLISDGMKSIISEYIDNEVR